MELRSFLISHQIESFEIIVSLNGDSPAEVETASLQLESLKPTIPELIIHKHFSPKGKGACLKSAFLKAQGENICFIDADLPYDLSFIITALKKREEGYDLITANRRMTASRFVVPIPLLQLAYGRHKLGVLFNFFVRKLFQIKTTDTQAGLKVMSYELAEQFFLHQHCPGFFYDIELFLVAQARRMKLLELPIVLYLNYEKSTIRIIKEGILALYWLTRIRKNQSRQEYAALHSKMQSSSTNSMTKSMTKSLTTKNMLFTADDWGLSPAINDGILELAQRGVVRRVSMMANSHYLNYRLDELLALHPDVSFGLHFNLTYGRPSATESSAGDSKFLVQNLSGREGKHFFGLKELTKRIFWQRQNKDFEKELLYFFNSQIKILKDHGVPISYLDSHHHIHLIPGMLPILSGALKQHQITVVRNVLNRRLLFSRKFLLWIYSWLAQQSLREGNFQSLPVLYPGESDFFKVNSLIRKFAQLKQPTEIIVHPASQGDLAHQEFPDSHNEARADEYWFLRKIAHYYYPKN